MPGQPGSHMQKDICGSLPYNHTQKLTKKEPQT